jgi:hypothetical protein
MRFVLLLLFSLLSGCASAPQAPAPPLFDDTRFAQPSQRISADEVFALTDAMRNYVKHDIGQQLRMKGAQRGLIDALYNRGELKLEYDSAVTRNAAEAFEARTGNCLSLVIMTAALAKEVGLPVRFQSVYVPETWSRSGNLYFSSGHVNLAIGKRPVEARAVFDFAEYVTIDFLTPREMRGVHTQVIDEDTIVAMYLNNRAAESLAQGRVDDAYWWARAAVEHMPTFLTPYNTLGVIYSVHGDAQRAADVLRYVVSVEPGNRQAMANLVPVLERLGRTQEAQELAQRLARLEPQPPFHYFNQGVAAMHARDYARAKSLFQQEVDRAAYYHEFHFWLALANLGLGDDKEARKHLAVALDNSTTRFDRDLYAAKLAHLKPATRLR